MTKTEKIVNRTTELVEPYLEERSFELVDLEYVKEAGNWYLRIYIDKEGGITVDDCEVISRLMSDALDVEDYIDESYILEVSSPGLGRPLKKDRDFQRSIGEAVEIKLYRPLEHRKDYEGVLVAYDADTVTIAEGDVPEDFDPEQLEGVETRIFARKDIALIRLAFDF